MEPIYSGNNGICRLSVQKLALYPAVYGLTGGGEKGGDADMDEHICRRGIGCKLLRVFYQWADEHADEFEQQQQDKQAKEFNRTGLDPGVAQVQYEHEENRKKDGNACHLEVLLFFLPPQ